MINEIFLPLTNLSVLGAELGSLSLEAISLLVKYYANW